MMLRGRRDAGEGENGQLLHAVGAVTVRKIFLVKLETASELEA